MPTLAIILQVILLVYHQVTTLFDFFPFNGVRFCTRREKLVDAGAAFVPMAVAPVGFILNNPSLMENGVVCHCILLGGMIGTWWIPYFFGPSPKWLELYTKIQCRTITPIPRRGTNPTPNLEHLILMVLSLLSTVVSWVAYRSVWGAFSPGLWKAWLIGVVIVSAIVYQCCLAGRKKSKMPVDHPLLDCKLP